MILLAPVQFVLFDAVGTILHPQPPVPQAYAEVGRRHGSQLDEVEVAARFRRAFERQEAVDRADGAGATSEARERERWRAIVGEVFDDASDPAALFDALWEHFALGGRWRIDADAAAVFAALAERRLPWGLASNFDGRLERIVRELPALADCRAVFVSSRLGWRKPSREFFTAIERALGLPSEQLLLVGDDLANDYRAARSAGWRAVLVDPAGASGVEPRVSRLNEILARL